MPLWHSQKRFAKGQVPSRQTESIKLQFQLWVKQALCPLPRRTWLRDKRMCALSRLLL